MLKFASTLQRSAVILLALSCSSTLFAQSYTDNRFAAGQRALAYGNHHQAIIEFRLACLGLMETPESYAHCKSLLFLAQLGNRQQQAARNTLLVIASLEEKHGAFTNSPLDPDTRETFVAAVLDNFGNEGFQQAPRFAAVLKQSSPPSAIDPASKPPSLAELRRLASSNAQDLELQEELALRLYRAEKVVDALRAAEVVGSADPENQNVRCIRATMRSARNRSLCSSFLEQITACPESLHTPFYIETRLRCYSEVKAWNTGRDYLAALSPASRSGANIERLARRIRKRATSVTEGANALGSPPVQGDKETASSTQSTTITNGQTPPATQPDAALLGRIAGTRARAGKALRATDREGLRAALLEARNMADQNPRVLEAHKLSGELAYLLTEWQTTVDYLVRAQQLGDIGTSHTFYLAAAYHEVDENELAIHFLQQSLNRGLVRTEIVDTYKKKIFGKEP